MQTRLRSVFYPVLCELQARSRQIIQEIQKKLLIFNPENNAQEEKILLTHIHAAIYINGKTGDVGSTR